MKASAYGRHPTLLDCVLVSLIVYLLFVSLAQAEDVTEGTRIIGTEESPAVLNVVPWQDRELGGNPASGNRQFRSVLDDALKPVDRGELKREVDYFNVLQKNQQKNSETR